MRRFLLLLLVACAMSAYGQHPSPSLKVHLLDCRNKENTVRHADPQLRLYRLPADTVSYQFSYKDYKNAEAIIDNFEPGIYRVAYTDIYTQEISKTYSLNDCGSNEITLCLDELEEYPARSLAALTMGDSIVVLINTNACFTYSREKMTITRTKAGYTVEFRILQRDKITTMQHQPVPVYKRLTLTAAQMTAFNRFENELMAPKTQGCTGQVNYKLIVKGKTNDYFDGGCLWDGYSYLKNALLAFERPVLSNYMLGFEPE